MPLNIKNGYIHILIESFSCSRNVVTHYYKHWQDKKEGKEAIQTLFDRTFSSLKQNVRLLPKSWTRLNYCFKMSFNDCDGGNDCKPPYSPRDFARHFFSIYLRWRLLHSTNSLNTSCKLFLWFSLFAIFTGALAY